MKDRTVDTAWLVVAPDGTETFYKPDKPDGPCLLVDVVYSRRKWWQQTYTRLIYSETDAVAHHAFIVRPRGADWEMLGVDEPLVLWRRRHDKHDWNDDLRLVIREPRKEIV
jgi:hypothetical protein